MPEAPDDPALPAVSRPGSVAPDAPLGNGWLIDAVGRRPVLLAIGMAAPDGTGIDVIAPEVTDAIRARYLGQAPGALCLIRPDQIVAARWTAADASAIRRAAAAIWEASA
jgi:3-(3-hydroxy-phenyl)propionate hydroxylase